jgi:hypothetical protein
MRGGETYGRGRNHLESEAESYKGYGAGAESARSHNNKRQLEDREWMEREEQDLRAKLRREQEDHHHEEVRRSKAGEEGDLRGKNPGPQADFHCFNCDGTGHMRKDCKNPPFCYCCKKSGHRSSVCPEKRGLKLCGFGIPGQGFYNIHIPTKPNLKRKSGEFWLWNLGKQMWR